MTLDEFKDLKKFEDKRVRMSFAYGDIVATLSSVTTDLDESRHLVYKNVEQSTLAGSNLDIKEIYYTPGDELISCVLEPLN